MRDKPKITEYDIFQYVFFPDELPENKLQIIEKDCNYADDVRFYLELKEDLSKELSYNIRKKLSELIPNYKLPTES